MKIIVGGMILLNPGWDYSDHTVGSSPLIIAPATLKGEWRIPDLIETSCQALYLLVQLAYLVVPRLDGIREDVVSTLHLRWKTSLV